MFSFIRYVVCRIGYIAAIVALFLMISIGYLVIAAPQYESTAVLYVADIGRIKDYQIVLLTREVHEMTIEKLKLSYTPEQLHGMITVVNPTGTRVLQVSVRCNKATDAEKIVNQLLASAQKYTLDVLGTEEPIVMSAGMVPQNPVSPNKILVIETATILSLVLGIGCIFIMYLFDNRIWTDDDVFQITGKRPILVIEESHEP